jgi:hypothetical protein
VGFSFIFPSFCALFAFVVKNSERQVIKSLSSLALMGGVLDPTANKVVIQIEIQDRGQVFDCFFSGNSVMLMLIGENIAYVLTKKTS